jgi:putative hydrolase of the HAD superfamily
MLRAIFFDAAGTLMETREPVGQSYSRIARKYGVDASASEVSAAFRRVFHNSPGLAFGPGHPADELRRLERHWWHELVAETFRGLGGFSDFAGYFDELFAFFGDPAHWIADPQAPAVLHELRADGLILGVLSNFDHRLYGILDGLGLRRYFDSVTISSEAGYAKPSPEVFEAALARHVLRPAEALHVGDSEHHDVAGAMVAGMPVALIDRHVPNGFSISGRVARIATLAAVRRAGKELTFT